MMGIAEKYGIEIRRWRNDRWEARHRDGSTDSRSAAEVGISGRGEGDWAIVRLRAGRTTYIPQDDMFGTGTVWYFDGSGWHSIYRRSAGASAPPDYLEEIKDNCSAGDILVESGPADELTVYDKDGVRYAMASEIAAVFDESSGRPPDPDELPDDPSELQIDAAALRLAASADRVILLRRNLGRIVAEWANYKAGDPVTLKMRQVLLKALEEANPSPTPGTTAIADYVNLGNDIATGNIGTDFRATGIDDKGAASADAIPNIAFCKLGSDVLAGCGAMFDAALQLRNMIKAENLAPGTKTGAKQVGGELNTALASYELDVAKGVSYLFTATDKVIKLVDAASPAAAATSQVATMMIAPLTTVVGVLTFARHVRKGHRARLRWQLLKKKLKEQRNAPYDHDLEACMNYLIGKSGRRLRTQASTAATALVSSAAGTILTVTAIAGGANAWNPVGWTLLGVAAVGGAGIVGYKLYKRWKREKRHAKRLTKYRGVTNATTAAMRLIDIHGGTSRRDQEAAGLILQCFGVTLTDLQTDRGKKAAIALVVRHLEK